MTYAPRYPDSRHLAEQEQRAQQQTLDDGQDDEQQDQGGEA